MKTPLARFTEKYDVDASTGCWDWQAHINRYGYGMFRFGGRLSTAYRFAYEQYRGPVPEGLQLDHLCRNRRCVNPAHLEPVTQAENARRGLNATKTHCVNGHLLDGDNVYRVPSRPRSRNCRACNRAAVARYTQRQKAAA